MAAAGSKNDRVKLAILLEEVRHFEELLQAVNKVSYGIDPSLMSKLVLAATAVVRAGLRRIQREFDEILRNN